MDRPILWVLLFVCIFDFAAAEPTLYERELEQWHQGRIEKLTKPDGYLSLVGLEWVDEKPREIPGVGTARLKGDSIVVELVDGFEFRGEPARTVELDTNRTEGKELVQKGTLHFYAIRRGHLKGLRIKDSQAPTRVDFQGVERFEIDTSFTLGGRLIPEAQEISVDSVVGASTLEKSPGWAEFKWQGRTYRARLVGEPDDDTFFMVFSDATAGDSTYSACRFLYVDRVQDDILSIDFNKSINPACAFTSFATCPLPPQENIFPFAITAGEKAPR